MISARLGAARGKHEPWGGTAGGQLKAVSQLFLQLGGLGGPASASTAAPS